MNGNCGKTRIITLAIDVEKHTRFTQKILVADDHVEVTDRISQILINNGYSNTTTKNKVDSYSSLLGYDLLMMDIVWPEKLRPREEVSELFGLSALQYVKDHSQSSRVILFSTHLFDLHDLSSLERADAYFKSSALAQDILGIVRKVAKFDQSDADDFDQTLVTKKTYDQDRMSKSTKTGDALNLIAILEELLEDGSNDPSLLGLTQLEYDRLLQAVQETKKSLSGDGLGSGKSFSEKVKTLVEISKLPANALEIVEKLRDLFW